MYLAFKKSRSIKEIIKLGYLIVKVFLFWLYFVTENYKLFREFVICQIPQRLILSINIYIEIVFIENIVDDFLNIIFYETYKRRRTKTTWNERIKRFFSSIEKNDHGESYNFEMLHGISLASKYIFKAWKLSTSWTIRKNNSHVVTYIRYYLLYDIFIIFRLL